MAVKRITGVPHRLLTADEFERMAEVGILDEDDHVELLDGELFQARPPAGPPYPAPAVPVGNVVGPHVACIARLNRRFVTGLGDRAIVFVQSLVRLSTHGVLEPDITVTRFRDDFYSDAPPDASDSLLVVEVAAATVRTDRNVKLPRYAIAGIPETWLVYPRRKRVTVYRDHTPDGYRTVTVHTRGAVLSPLAFPDLELCWEDIFGRR